MRDLIGLKRRKVPIWQKFEEEALRRLLHTIVSQCLPNIQISEQDDFFLCGLDSVKTVEIVQAARAGLRQRLKPSDVSKVSSRMVYENPSIEKLARAISNLLNQDGSSDSGQLTGEQALDRVNAMTMMVEKYTRGLDQAQDEPKGPIERPELQIALTGSTGSPGSQLLRTFMEDSKIKKIWCLNRSENAQKKVQQDPMTSNMDHSQVTHIKINIGQAHLGLAEASMAELIENVDIIVHNAWKVDFNQTLASFEDHIRGTRSILDWSIKSPRRPRVVFISSVSSVANWPQIYSQQLVPEAPLLNYEIASYVGYGESKFVAEKILGISNLRAGVPVSILQVGQIAGSTVPADAAWPVQEWLPSLVKTSKSLGAIPEGLPEIDWIPINKVAKIIKEIIDANSNNKDVKVYDLVNPRTIPWNSILDTLRRHCGEKSRVVPLATWLEILESMDVDTLDERELASKPAIKVLPMLRELMDAETATKYSTMRGLEVSRTMKGLSPVNQTWLHNWLHDWDSAE